MDITTAILVILFSLWTSALVVNGMRKPQVSAVTQPLVQGETLEVKLQQGGKIQVHSKQTEKKIPRGKFPAFVDKLSEKELFDRLSAALKGRPEEAIKIGLGGDTFWFSGNRTDKEFNYSDDGIDLFPITFYYN